MDVIKRTATSGPFRFDSQRKEPSGHEVRLHGTTVPPDKTHTIMDDGSEFIWIYRRSWRKRSSDGRWEASTFYLDEPLTSAGTLFGSDQVRGARCLGEVIEDGRGYLTYEYEVSSRWDKARISIWKLLTDYMTGLPVKFLGRIALSDGSFSEEVVTRVYDPGLKIEPPAPHFR